MALNYRPISFAPVTGKTLKRITLERLAKFLEDNKITDAQQGFRNKRSLLINLLDFFHGIDGNWDNHIPSNVIHLDFQKAIDKIPHEGLLTELSVSRYRSQFDFVVKRLAHMWKATNLAQETWFGVVFSHLWSTRGIRSWTYSFYYLYQRP